MTAATSPAGLALVDDGPGALPRRVDQEALQRAAGDLLRARQEFLAQTSRTSHDQ